MIADSSPSGGPAPADDVAEPHWLAVFSLALGVFGLVTAEFLPASLLTAMASDLRVSEGAAGQSVTATALVAAIAAPALPLLVRRLDRRWVMFAFSAMLLVSNLLAVLARDLTVLLVARVVLGVALGGFWAMAAPLAMRLVPQALFPRAMSLILTGVSVATVCAAPIGAWMGATWGWRSAFVAAGVIALVTLLVQVLTLPALRPRGSTDLRQLGALLGRAYAGYVPAGADFGILQQAGRVCDRFGGAVSVRWGAAWQKPQPPHPMSTLLIPLQPTKRFEKLRELFQPPPAH